MIWRYGQNCDGETQKFWISILMSLKASQTFWDSMIYPNCSYTKIHGSAWPLRMTVSIIVKYYLLTLLDRRNIFEKLNMSKVAKSLCRMLLQMFTIENLFYHLVFLWTLKFLSLFGDLAFKEEIIFCISAVFWIMESTEIMNFRLQAFVLRNPGKRDDFLLHEKKAVNHFDKMTLKYQLASILLKISY